MYIHRHLNLLNLADASVICLSSSVRRNVAPPLPSSVDSSPAPSMTKDEEGSLITTSDAARIVEFSYLLRFSLSCQVPVLASSLTPHPSLARPTSVMMNGVAGGGIYPEIQYPGGIY